MRKRQRLGKELSCLAYFSFFVGMWSLNETDVVSLLVENRTMDSLIPYFCLMLVVPPFIAFFDSYLDINNRFVKVVFIGASFIIDSVLIILHFTHISEFRENVLIIQMLLLVALLYMIINVIIKLLRKVYTRHVIICTIGLSLFFVALLGDIFVHYNDASDSDTLGRYVFLVFVVLMAWDMIKDAYSIIEKGRRIRQMELFALTDTMTGLFNRNAFESQASVKKRLDGLVAVVADANGLKECNDTYGHEAGDEYILQVAQIFHDVYGKYGDCYRTGGDEFCCIIPAGKNLNMDHLHKVFLAKVHAANMEGQRGYKMGVAIGSALYNANIDADFRMLVKRADAKMYENKKEYKSGIA